MAFSTLSLSLFLFVLPDLLVSTCIGCEPFFGLVVGCEMQHKNLA